MRKTRKEIRYKKYMIGIIMILLTLVNFIIIPNKISAVVQTYSIVYNANGGTGTPATQIKAKDKTITLSSKIPQRTGYKFLGWATTSTAKTAKYKPGSKYSANSGLRLFAVWQANTYKISYNANGGSGAPAAQTKTYGKSLILSTLKPTKKGYIFQGWAASKSASSPQYKAGGTFRDNKDTILYAVWKIKTYTIKYDANKGVNAPATQTKKYGQTITLSKNKPKRANHTFIGWAKSQTSQLPSYKAGDKYSANESIVLYAYWMQDTFKITYHANGGSGGVSSQIKKRQGDLKLSKNIPRRSGYTFLGWGLSKDATTISYYPGDMYTQNAEKELYAIWGKTRSVESKKKYVVFAASPTDGDLGVVDANFVYCEDYKKSGTKMHFYNHRTYLSINGAYLNDCYGLSVVPPKFVTHKNMKTGKEKKFTVNRPEDVLEVADYTFFYANREKVSYNVNDSIQGSSGYIIVFGNAPFGGDNVELQLCNGDEIHSKNLKKSVQMSNKGYYYSLGKLVKKYTETEDGKEVKDDNGLQKKQEIQRESIHKVIAVCNGETIYDTDIKPMIEEKKIYGIVTEEEIENIIYEEVVRRKLDKEVAKNGCEKSMAEAESYIYKIRTELPMTENYNDYLSFLRGIGAEENIYWETQIEPCRKKLGRYEYLERLYTEFCTGKELSMSAEFKGIDKLIKSECQTKVNKYDFIQMLKSLIVKMSAVSIEKEVVASYL